MRLSTLSVRRRCLRAVVSAIGPTRMLGVLMLLLFTPSCEGNVVNTKAESLTQSSETETDLKSPCQRGCDESIERCNFRCDFRSSTQDCYDACADSNDLCLSHCEPANSRGFVSEEDCLRGLYQCRKDCMKTGSTPSCYSDCRDWFHLCLWGHQPNAQLDARNSRVPGSGLVSARSAPAVIERSDGFDRPWGPGGICPLLWLCDATGGYWDTKAGCEKSCNGMCLLDRYCNGSCHCP